jgi:3-isopropylmalate/(R)-2-methylmalate dehydratase small subunit
MIFEGKVAKFGDNISTDLMMPAGAMVKTGMTDREKAGYCLHSCRPGWAQTVPEGTIIIAGRNWGCGSSRPAPRFFLALKTGIIVAESMSRLFFRNAVNAGLPVLICKGVSEAFDEGDTARVNMETGEVTNLTKGITLQGENLAPDSPPAQILKAGGLANFMRQELGMK